MYTHTLFRHLLRAMYLTAITAFIAGVFAPIAAEAMTHNRNYSYIYFENGYPTRLSKFRRPQSQADEFARENPDLVVQTGYYSLRLDCDDMRLTGFDALSGSDYITALNEDVAIFSPADFTLRVERDGVAYACESGIVQDRDDQYVRLIESGQYVQRFDHLGLVFTADDGSRFEKLGRLEITAWADHVVFRLDFSGVSGISRTEIELTSPSGKTFRSTDSGEQTTLALQPHLDREYEALQSERYLGEAYNIKTNEPLDLRFDEEEYGLRVELPIESVRMPGDADRVDEFLIEVKNPSDVALNIPLIFNEIRPQAITGTCMVLCEERDGRPTGTPVQISKNWHRKQDAPTVHEGSWLRGYTMIPLEPGETRRLRLRVVYGYWGDAAAVSYAQLCVIGYGGYWKWDESALGCWGESTTYDPTQHLGGAFIDDVRPAFTTNMSGAGTHGWTENVGGGDFLIYNDKNNVFRWAKRLKTAYRWTGPNMTEVLYSGVTNDDKIRFNYRVRSVSTNDYHRRFHGYRYDFLEDVDSPQRLVFHQMAADYYSTVNFDQFYCGDRNGLRSTHAREDGPGGYDAPSVPFDQSWLTFDDTTTNDGVARSRRGVLNMMSTLDGQSLPLNLHPYRQPNGRKHLLLDVGSGSVQRSYSAGDIVRGELEIVLPPKSVEDYWGEDREFTDRLQSYDTNPWQAVADEYRYNVQLDIEMHAGELIRRYPVEIRVSPESNGVLADFTINRGGIGHVPIILRGVPQGRSITVQRYLDGEWVLLESVDLDQNAYYQGVLNAKGLLDCAFSIQRPSRDLEESWRVRFLAD